MSSPRAPALDENIRALSQLGFEGDDTAFVLDDVLNAEAGDLDALLDTALPAPESEVTLSKLNDTVQALEARLHDTHSIYQHKIEAMHGEIEALRSAPASPAVMPVQPVVAATAPVTPVATPVIIEDGEKVARLEAEAEKLRKSLADVNSKYEAAKASAASAQASINAESSVASETAAKLGQLEEKLRGVEMERSVLTGKLSVARESVSTLTERIAELEASGDKSAEQIEETSKLRKQIATLNEKIGDLEGRASQCQAETESARAERQKTADLLKSAEERIAELEGGFTGAQGALDGLKNEKKMIERDLALSQQRAAGLETALSEEKAAAKSLRAAHERLAADSGAERAELCDKLKTRETELKALKARVARVAEMEKHMSELEELRALAKSQADELKTLRSRLTSEMRTRRDLYNTLQELRGNIRVYARIRPRLAGDGNVVITAKGDSAGVTAALAAGKTFKGGPNGEEEPTVTIQAGHARPQSYAFDAVFGPKATQADVFHDMEPLILSVLDGFKLCVFAYGQTGSGKTHTAFGGGTPETIGVCQRSLARLFEEMDKREGWVYKVKVSILEIYCDSLRDLLRPALDPSVTGPPPPKLEVKLSNKGRPVVAGLVEVGVNSVDQVMQILKVGLASRATGATNMNAASSRSHCLLTVTIDGRNEGLGLSVTSKVCFVDLAGSERVDRSGVTGQALKEATSINASLSMLAQVMMALQGDKGHIPYRNSKLTYVMQDFLAPGAKVLMFVNLAPSEESAGETKSSLKFAMGVRNVELGAAAKTTGKA